MNNLRMLCSAPNWFQSSLCDSSSQGVVAIGTHHWITLLLVTPSTQSHAKNDHVFLGELLGHKDRVQCCKFSFFSSNILAPHNKHSNINNKESLIELLVTASSDCSIRIWNIETRECLIVLKPNYKMDLNTFHKQTNKERLITSRMSTNDEFHLYPITALTVTNSNYKKGNKNIDNKQQEINTLIISGDSKGYVMCWNPMTNNRIQKRISDTMVITLEVCPYHDINTNNLYQVAIGYKSGTVLLLNMNENNINELCRFIGHDSDIQSLSWCHKYVNIDKEEMKIDEISRDNKIETMIDYLPNVFATASKDKYVRFWNTLTGECLFEIQIEGKKDMKYTTKDRIWYSLLWLTPFKIFITGSNGNIWSIDLKQIPIIKPHQQQQENQYNKMKKICLNKQQKDLPKNMISTFEEGHTRCIFNIIPIKNRPQNILTVSLDRNMVYWDINTQKALWIMRCLGGYVYDLDFAPWNPSLLAVAVGDKMIRIWTVSDTQNIDKTIKDKEQKQDEEDVAAKYTINPFYNLHDFEEEHHRKDRKSKYRQKKRQQLRKNDDYHCKGIWRGLKDKITAIKWHPTDNGWLVYGTDKGGIGCIDINSSSNHGHVRLLTYHQTFVTQCDWKIIAMKYRNDYNITDITLETAEKQNDNKYKNRKRKKGKKKYQKTQHIESGFRIYSLSRDGQIFEGDGWKPNTPSININKYILSANENIKDILRTSSDENIVWTCFSVEVINPFDQQKYKEAVKRYKDGEDININHYTGQKMVIGSGNGLIYILNGDWKLLCSFHDYNSLICCIQINPFYNVSDTFYEERENILNKKDIKCKNWIAAGTVDGYVLFYDFITNTDSKNKSNMIYKIKHSQKHKSVVGIKWHPFDPNVIVSISNDKRHPLYIWDLSMIPNGKQAKKILHIESDITKDQFGSWFTNYHHSRYLSVEWSHKDPFILYTASEDQTCRRLNIKDILSKTNRNIYCENIKYHQLKGVSFNCSKQSQPMIVKIKASSKKSIKSIKTEQQFAAHLMNKKQSISKHRGLFRSFETIKVETSINTLWKLIKYFTGFISNDEETNLCLLNQLELEANNTLFLYTNDISKDQISNWMATVLQRQQSGLYPVQLLSSMSYQMQHLMQNDSKSIIEKELNKFNSNQTSQQTLKTFGELKKESVPELPSLLSLLMSPTLGRQQWLNSMLNLCKYFKHPKIGLYHNAAAIYLSLSSPQYIYECIDMYCNIDCFSEALIIARYHLLPNHPIIKKILCLYAEKYLSKKNYVNAIQCYLSTLCIYKKNTEIYLKQFIEIMRKYVLDILLKHYFINTFQLEYNTFLSNKLLKKSKISKKKVNKRRLSKMESHCLILLYDIINLLCDITPNLKEQTDDNNEEKKNDNYCPQITDMLSNDIGKENVIDIFAMYWMFTLCQHSLSPNIKQIIDSNKMFSKNKLSFINISELFLWKSLFQFTAMLEIDKYHYIDITHNIDNIKDKKDILETYSMLKFSFRIDHITQCYILPNNHDELKRIHCIKFANSLLQCFLYHNVLDENIKNYVSEFESIIWESLNYGSTFNILLLLHEYIGCILSFWEKNDRLSSCDSFIVAKSIFNTLELISNDLRKDINIQDLVEDYLMTINKLGSTNQSFKGKLVIKFFVLFMSSIQITENIDNILNNDEYLWLFIQNMMNDNNINGIQQLIEKCNKAKMFMSKQLKDPYLTKYKTRNIAKQCVYSIIDNICI